MNKNPYLDKIERFKNEPKTTGFGVVGEGLTAIGIFLPPPFNVMAIGAGLVVKGIAWYFTKDRETPDA